MLRACDASLLFGGWQLTATAEALILSDGPTYSVSDGAKELRLMERLQDISHDPGAETFVRRNVGVAGRKDNRNQWRSGPDLFDEPETVRARQMNIHDRYDRRDAWCVAV